MKGYEYGSLDSIRREIASHSTGRTVSTNCTPLVRGSLHSAMYAMQVALRGLALRSQGQAGLVVLHQQHTPRDNEAR